MNLTKTSGVPFTCTCKGCERRMVGGTVGLLPFSTQRPVYADLDGEPFKAYYCEPCADKLWVACGVQS
jgi:hypothetical protein